MQRTIARASCRPIGDREAQVARSSSMWQPRNIAPPREAPLTCRLGAALQRQLAQRRRQLGGRRPRLGAAAERGGQRAQVRTAERLLLFQ